MYKCEHCGVEVEMKPVRKGFTDNECVDMPFVKGLDVLHDTVHCLNEQVETRDELLHRCLKLLLEARSDCLRTVEELSEAINDIRGIVSEASVQKDR